MICRCCGKEFESGSACPFCGHPISHNIRMVHCRKCGNLISMYAKECPLCGKVRSKTKLANTLVHKRVTVSELVKVTGISSETVYNIVNGRVSILESRSGHVKKILDYLGIKLGDVL